MKPRPSKHLKSAPSANRDLVLCLIREELKSRKFFSGLQKLGLDYCFFQPHLDKPILSAIGLDCEDQEVLNFYFRLIEKRGAKIRENEASIMKQVRKVYEKLVTKRMNRAPGSGFRAPGTGCPGCVPLTIDDSRLTK